MTGIDAPAVDARVFDMGVPLLGICYGMQAMATQLGGEVETSTRREFGHADISLQADSALTAALD